MNKTSRYSLIKKNPEKTVWQIFFPNDPAPKKTLSDVLTAYAKDPEYKKRHWLTKNTGLIRNFFDKKLMKEIGAVTGKEWIEVIKQKNYSKDSADFATNGFFNILKFAKEGKIIINMNHVNGQNIRHNNIATMQITQQEYKSTDEVLELINASRGRHAEFREEIVRKIKEMPAGQSFLFAEPENMPKVEAEYNKTLKELKAVVNEAIDRSGKKLDYVYIANKKIFAIIPQQNGGKNA